MFCVDSNTGSCNTAWNCNERPRPAEPCHNACEAMPQRQEPHAYARDMRSPTPTPEDPRSPTSMPTEPCPNARDRRRRAGEGNDPRRQADRAPLQRTTLITRSKAAPTPHNPRSPTSMPTEPCPQRPRPAEPATRGASDPRSLLRSHAFAPSARPGDFLRSPTFATSPSSTPPSPPNARPPPRIWRNAQKKCGCDTQVTSAFFLLDNHNN